MSRSNGRERARRQFTLEAKAPILRRHLVNKVPVSDLCDEYQIQFTLCCFWQRQAVEPFGAARQDSRTQRGLAQSEASKRARVAALEARLAKKDAIITVVSEEYLALKRGSSGSFR